MKTSSYALSRAERGWLMVSLAFLSSALICGWLLRLVIRAYASAGLVWVHLVTDVPVLFLLSLSLGFLAATTGHYLYRIVLVPEKKEVVRG
jgi:hypothetical protein